MGPKLKPLPQLHTPNLEGGGGDGGVTDSHVKITIIALYEDPPFSSTALLVSFAQASFHNQPSGHLMSSLASVFSFLSSYSTNLSPRYTTMTQTPRKERKEGDVGKCTGGSSQDCSHILICLSVGLSVSLIKLTTSAQYDSDESGQ